MRAVDEVLHQFLEGPSPRRIRMMKSSRLCKEAIIGISREREGRYSAYGDVKELSEYRARRSTRGRQSTVASAPPKGPADTTVPRTSSAALRGRLIPPTASPFPHRWSKRRWNPHCR